MNKNDHFLGVLGLKDGKWVPQSKFGGDKFGSALLYAEELDKKPDFDAVKVLRISTSGAGEQKEMWVSPRLKARMEAATTQKLRSGVQQTKEKLRAERKGALRPS